MTITRFPGSQSEPTEQKSAYAFGDVIRKYRARAKYNQRDLAERMGVNQNTICNWETDKRQPDAQKGTVRLLNEADTANCPSVSSVFWIFTVLWTRTDRKIWKLSPRP